MGIFSRRCALCYRSVTYRPYKAHPARILVAYVVSGVILGAVGLYQPLVDFAGAGASVPLTGFGNLLAKGMKKLWKMTVYSESSRADLPPARQELPPQ